MKLGGIIRQSMFFLPGYSNCPKPLFRLDKVLPKLAVCYFDLFLANVPILYPLKTPENQWFSGVFRGYKRATLVRNELTLKNPGKKWQFLKNKNGGFTLVLFCTLEKHHLKNNFIHKKWVCAERDSLLGSIMFKGYIWVEN